MSFGFHFSCILDVSFISVLINRIKVQRRAGRHPKININTRVLKSEIQGMARKKMEMIYENVGHRTQTNVKTNRQLPLQGNERVKMKSYRSVSVCLVLLCVLLLTAVIVLCVLIYTNNQQLNIKNKNITEEKDQLLTKYTNITEERDQLLTKYTIITEERDKLVAKFNNITTQLEQFKQINKLWTHFNGDVELLQYIKHKDGWIYYQTSLYFISSEKKSWTESRSYCRERGADLIFINNKEEQNFISTHSGGDKVWIGLSDIEEEGVWKWVDGSTMTSSFWNKKEPNTSEGDEDCVLIELRGWADYPCSHDYKWICEKKFN
ncbi:uncharacterized protein [Paramisgurnus dabryanus]|uniref:uncharacterized protein n=1 Tax=Paramisgurnus dabryanus TaxID=90735 RepID=UPI003CCF901D